MGWCMAARVPRRAQRSLLGFLGVLIATAIAGTSPALANAGKVLVFTGTAGTLSPGSADAAAAIQTLAAANNFTADVTADATQINAANLAGYRAVVFVNSSGDVLTAPEETDLQNYVQTGGGFVGIGQTAMLEQGGAAFFNTLIGLTGNPRVTATGTTTSSQDVEFLDRVHPATRSEPMLWPAHNDTWYTWTTNPTGTVHTVARVRFNTIPDGTSVTNDTVKATSTNQPQSERAASWCRDIQQGRSFYTELGANAGAYADANITKQLLGAIQWASGMVRGNCKATINSNYVSQRITPQNPDANSNIYGGELTNMAIADDGRIFYTGRSICSQGYAQITNWDTANVGLGCGTIHVYDPNVPATSEPAAARISQVANLSVFGAKGNGAESGQTSSDEEGLLAIVLDPDFTKGRPYIYVQYYPYYGGEQGKNTTPTLGMGFDRNSYRGERRLSRFTYDGATHTLVPGSEKVIMHWDSSVYSCCHEGASAAFDSKGNLYVTNGDNISNAANSTNGGYTNSDASVTAPCPGAAATTHCAQTPADQRPAGTILYNYGDARGTVANSNTYDGKLIRIHPLADPGDTPGVGTTYTIPGADSPNGANLFPPDSSAVTSGMAKPEIFAMGMRNDYTLHIDPKTDALTTAWVGPDQGTDSTTWGEAKTEDATMLNSAGFYGWPYCQGGNRWDYRAKLPSASGGTAANLSDNVPGTVGGGADGQTGAFWDCRGPIPNTSPYNTGLQMTPAPKPVNIWYGPQGGCYGYQKNANGVGIYTNSNATAAPTIFRSCPWVSSTGSQAPMDGGIYRKPTGDHPNAWPSYWDGRWFLMDFTSSGNIRHALLMDPATQFNGGLPVSVDSLTGIVPSSFSAQRVIKEYFGPDGALYVEMYSGSYYASNNANMGIWRFNYIGGADTPGPDPQASVPPTTSTVTYSIGKSGGVSYKWDFGDGTSTTTDSATTTHTYASGGDKTATLTVTYADGDTASKTVTAAAVAQPAFVTTPGDVTVSVPTVLAISLGAPASFGALTPSVDHDYTASTGATVLATSGDATLTISDPGTTAPGHLINGTSVLPSALQAKAASTAGTGGTFAAVGTTPTTLLTYSGPTNADPVTISFSQHIGVTDALRAGSYSKTLTFTLSTTTP